MKWFKIPTSLWVSQGSSSSALSSVRQYCLHGGLAMEHPRCIQHITAGLIFVRFIPVKFLCQERFYPHISGNPGINCTLANVIHSLLKIPTRNVEGGSMSQKKIICISFFSVPCLRLFGLFILLLKMYTLGCLTDGSQFQS